MPFIRHLDDEFIEQLNKLHDDTNSWWHKIVNYREVFVAIRNNSLNAYIKGGSIGRIEWQQGRIAFKVHHSYLVFAKPGKARYADLLLERNRPESICIDNAQAFAKNIAKVAGLINLQVGEERKAENKIAANNAIVVDKEAAFTSEAEKGDTGDVRQDDQAGRVDLVAVDKGTLVFTELKLYSNPELYARTEPAVCGQLITYHRWLTDYSEEIVGAYEELGTLYGRLKGKTFKRRCDLLNGKLCIAPIPRLLIVGFDSEQVKRAKAFAGSICKNLGGRIKDFDRRHIRLVGNAKKVKGHHLR